MGNFRKNGSGPAAVIPTPVLIVELGKLSPWYILINDRIKATVSLLSGMGRRARRSGESEDLPIYKGLAFPSRREGVK